MAGSQIVMVTGKGGVGKSSISAGLALSYAQQGKRTLLVEFGEESYFQYFFGLPQLDFQPSKLDQAWCGLEVARWDGTHCLRDYVAHTLKISKLTDLFFENAAMKAFMEAAPALADVSLLGKLTSGIRKIGPQFPYEVVVVDGYAAGHMMALVRAPKGLAEAVRVGPMGDQCRSILRVLHDPQLCRFLIVSLAEELPVTESLELFADLKAEVGHPPQVVLNRLLPEVDLKKQNSPAHQEFVDYLKAVYERQKLSRERLTKEKSLPLEVKQVFATETFQMASSIADQLKEQLHESN